eukprot:3304876-Pleurochrysis_carterae.AAC.2
MPPTESTECIRLQPPFIMRVRSSSCIGADRHRNITYSRPRLTKFERQRVHRLVLTSVSATSSECGFSSSEKKSGFRPYNTKNGDVSKDKRSVQFNANVTIGNVYGQFANG